MISSNRRSTRPVSVALTLPTLLFVVSDRVRAQEPVDKKLDAAIGALRNINADKLNEAQKGAKAKEIENAWETIRASGKTGTQPLHPAAG